MRLKLQRNKTVWYRFDANHLIQAYYKSSMYECYCINDMIKGMIIDYHGYATRTGKHFHC